MYPVLFRIGDFEVTSTGGPVEVCGMLQLTGY